MSKPEPKLTVKKALQETARIWGKLAKSGAKNKPKSDYKYYCPCCEFVAQKVPSERDFGMTCTGGLRAIQLNEESLAFCPMKSLWPRGCCDDSSPYQKWDKVSSSDCTPSKRKRKRYAAIIANAARRLLKQLAAREAKRKAKVAK